jgi:hypothetical protein
MKSERATWIRKQIAIEITREYRIEMAFSVMALLRGENELENSNLKPTSAKGKIVRLPYQRQRPMSHEPVIHPS